jgi:hypothetical protein
MTHEQHIAVLKRYAEKFTKWSSECCPGNFDQPPGVGRAVKHINWMIHEMLHRLEAHEDRPGQADRWIGFIQGVLWNNGFFTIDDMKAHNTEPA